MNDEKTNLYQAKITRRSILSKMKNIKNWDDIEDIIISCFSDMQLAEESFNAIDEFREKNWKINENKITKKFTKKILQLSKLQLMEKIGNFDALTQLAFSSLENIEKEWLEYKFVSDELFIGHFNQEGKFGTITGGLGSGKTHFSVLMIEKFLLNGFVVFTNVPVLQKKENLYIINKFSELIQRIAEAKKKRKKSIFVLDEGALSYKKQDATTTGNKTLDSFLTMLRKLDLSILYIVQTELYLPTLANFFETIRFHKPSKKQVIITTNDKKYNISNIPAKVFPFHTKARSFFEIDLKNYAQVEKILQKYGI